MAELLKINQSQISEIERGIRPMSVKYEDILVARFGNEICEKHSVETDNDRRIPQSNTTIIDKSKGRVGDNAKEIKKAGRDFYEEHPCKEDKVIIEALTKEIEHLTAMLAEKDKRIESLENGMARKDAQIDSLIALLEKK